MPSSQDPGTTLPRANGGWLRRTVGIAAAAVVAAPFLTTTFRPGTALVIQAVLILAVVLVVLAVGARRGRIRPRLAAVPPWWPAAVLLYGAAAVWGGAVGLASGNAVGKVAGQVLAMGLLPLAFAAGMLAPGGRSWRSLAAWLLAAVAAGGVYAMIVGIAGNLAGDTNRRLLLPNGTSPAGAAVLALLLAVPLFRLSSRRSKVLAATGVALTLALLVATGVRSFIVALPVGAVVLAVLAVGSGPLLRRPAVRALTAAVLAGALALAALAAWWLAPRRDILAAGLPRSAAFGDLHRAAKARGDKALPALNTPAWPLPGASGAVLQLKGRVDCTVPGHVVVQVWRLEPRLALVHSDGFNVAAGGSAFFRASLLPGTLSGNDVLVLRERLDARCTLAALSAVRLRPRLLALAAVKAERTVLRHETLYADSDNALAGDPTLWFRFKEAAAVVDAIGAESWARRLVGAGLGATVALDTKGYNNWGQVVQFGETNYLHNYYLFLAYKLGMLGTLLVLAALAAVVVAAVRGGSRFAGGSAERLFLSAVAGSWVAYAFMSLAAPEILDFRMAPLWGLLFAVAARVSRSGSEAGT